MPISRQLSRSALLTALSLIACGGRTDVGDLLPEPDGFGASGGQVATGGQPLGVGGGFVWAGGGPIGSGGGWSGGAFATGGALLTGGAFPSGGAFWAGGTGPGGSGGSGGAVNCPPEYFDPPGDPPGDCKPVSHCSPGWYAYWAPTPWSDRVCAPCKEGYSLKEDSSYCIQWSSCAFDEIIEVSGTNTTDVVCGPNPAIHAILAGDYWPQVATPPGNAVLLTNDSGYPRFRRYSSPGLLALDDTVWSRIGPYQNSLLLRGSGGLVYFLDTALAYTNPFGYGSTPLVSLIDGSSLSELWRSMPGWYGGHMGATVLADDTLVVLTQTYDTNWRYDLARWTSTGAHAEQSLDSIFNSYDYVRLVGSDAAGNLHLIQAYPLELIRLDSSGAFLDRTAIDWNLASIYRGAVTPSGATLVSGRDPWGYPTIARLENTGELSFLMTWPGPTEPRMLLAHGENAIVGGCTREPWSHQVAGPHDALVVEFSPSGSEVRSWQFGGGGDDCVEAGDVASDGRITVAAYENYTVQLVELLP